VWTPAGGFFAETIRTTDAVTQTIEKVYGQAGTPLVRVPYGECRSRALFILDTVRQCWPRTDNLDEPDRTAPSRRT
jgi:hypothetical protein